MIHWISNKYLRRLVIVIGAIPCFIVFGIAFFLEELFTHIIPMFAVSLVEAWRDEES